MGKVAYLKTGGAISLRPDLQKGYGTGGQLERFWMLGMLNDLGYDVDVVSAVDKATRSSLSTLPDLGYRVEVKPDQLAFNGYDALIVEMGVQNLKFEDGIMRCPQLVRTLDIIKAFEGPCLFNYTDRMLKFTWYPEKLSGSLWDPYRDFFSSEDVVRNKRWYLLHRAMNGPAWHSTLARGEGASTMAGTGIRAEDTSIFFHGYDRSRMNINGWFDYRLSNARREYDLVYTSRYKDYRKRALNEYWSAKPDDATICVYGSWKPEQIDELPVPVDFKGMVPTTEIGQALATGRCYMNILSEKHGEAGWLTAHREECAVAGCISLFTDRLHGAVNQAGFPELVFRSPEMMWDTIEAIRDNRNAWLFGQLQTLHDELPAKEAHGKEILSRAIQSKPINDVSVKRCAVAHSKIIPIAEDS